MVERPDDRPHRYGLRLRPSRHAELVKLAALNDRTLTAELDRAVAEHIKRHLDQSRKRGGLTAEVVRS